MLNTDGVLKQTKNEASGKKLQHLAHGEKESKGCLEMSWLPDLLVRHHSGYQSSVFQVRLLCK